MPIYEYTCKKCGDFDIVQRITEDPLKKCPTCGAKVTKLISRSAFHLKGSGWYMTDYGKNGPNKASSSSEETKSTSSESKESKSSGDSTASSSTASSSTSSSADSASSSTSSKDSSAAT